MKLRHDRLWNFIRVEEYKPGFCLTVSYWNALARKDQNQFHCFSVQVDPHDPGRPLVVVHVPPMEKSVVPSSMVDPEHVEDAASIADSGPEAHDERVIGADGTISLERILVNTINVRTRQKLWQLKEELKAKLGLKDGGPSLQAGSPAVLAVPILQPCLTSEQMFVTVDTHSGLLLAHVPAHEKNPYMSEIQSCLNDDRSRLDFLVSQLRHVDSPRFFLPAGPVPG